MPPDTAEAADAKLTPALIRAVADRLMAHPFQCWFYGDSVGFEGLMAASEVLDDPRYADFCHGFTRAWATRRTPWQPDDNTAPGHVMCTLVETRNDAVLREGVLDLARHLLARRKIGPLSVTFEDTLRSLRMPYGGVKLTAAQQAFMHAPGAGIWLDCMHFDPPFFAHLHGLDPAGGWAQEAVTQILGYRDILRDDAGGLYRHYWLEKTGASAIDGWGRGQGWALLGLLDVAHHVPGDTPRIHEVRAAATDLARTMLRWQQADGNWHCMVHEAASGPESSTAAFMATAFYRAIAWGLLDADEFRAAADRAFAAMVANLDEAGNLTGVSAAVMSALVQQHYWHVPLNRIVPWGQGPVLTAIAARRALG